MRPIASVEWLTQHAALETAGQRVLSSLVTQHGVPLGFTRLDVAFPSADPTTFQLLEVQAGDPSAMGWADALADALGGHATLMPSHRAVFEALTPGRRIAFCVLDGSIVESDHELLREHYASNGWEALRVDPRELSWNGTHLLARGRPVDALFRDALDELFELPSSRTGGQALRHALAANAVVLMNPLAAAGGDDKSLLEPLSHELPALVPWTRVVREREVDWNGREVALRELLRDEARELVLKPVDGYGGFGITLGRFVDGPTWQKAVDEALTQPGRFIVQRFTPLPRAHVEILDGREFRTMEAWVVHSLWFHPTPGAPSFQLVGGYRRASVAPVVNVHQGGGLGVVCWKRSF
ncbi:MAG: circularly permuted type 2 ATP-grasp protein [Myxococcaceae bacterium]|nr:circularly permuted type 2 ATP-grasp protein [Myxococcaceae bacterium]